MADGVPAMSKRSMREDWETPPDLFARLHREFGFTMDAAATAANAKVPRYLGPGSDHAADALAADWSGEVVWLNPPYGYKNLWAWMRKAYSQSRHATVVCLVPAHTGQPWWHEWVIGKATEIRWIKGKVKFVGAPSSAPFPSCIVIYRSSARPGTAERETSTCQKVIHDGRQGYLHGPDDDSPYDVDGVRYCGRCHVALNGAGRCEHGTPVAERET